MKRVNKKEERDVTWFLFTKKKNMTGLSSLRVNMVDFRKKMDIQ